MWMETLPKVTACNDYVDKLATMEFSSSPIALLFGVRELELN